jgi:hypothetical protein
MTRTDVMASSRPQASDAAPMRRGSRRGLLVLPVALLLAAALLVPTTALATTTTESGYSQKAPEPKSGTSPAKEKSTPKAATAPATSTSAPTTTPKATTATTLPFTGFDLRWTIGFGLLFMGVGFSIVTAQRRQRRGSRS